MTRSDSHPPPSPGCVSLADMTWPEARDALADVLEDFIAGPDLAGDSG